MLDFKNREEVNIDDERFMKDGVTNRSDFPGMCEKCGIILTGPEETRSFAERLAPGLPLNSVIALYGDLGAGKTTFVQGLVRGLGGEQEMAHSPTFTYMHLYPTHPPIYHFDLYRLAKPNDFFAMGFEEAFESGSIVAIEWPERLAAHLPPHRLEIRLAHTENSRRSLELQWI